MRDLLQKGLLESCRTKVSSIDLNRPAKGIKKSEKGRTNRGKRNWGQESKKLVTGVGFCAKDCQRNNRLRLKTAKSGRESLWEKTGQKEKVREKDRGEVEENGKRAGGSSEPRGSQKEA